MKSFYFPYFFGCVLCADDSILRWAADADSGAPNAFYEEGDLSNLAEFEKIS
jgi:hypothetical protein